MIIFLFSRPKKSLIKILLSNDVKKSFFSYSHFTVLEITLNAMPLVLFFLTHTYLNHFNFSREEGEVKPMRDNHYISVLNGLDFSFLFLYNK